MKKVVAFLLAIVFLIGIAPVHAAPGRKGASDKAYEHASDNAVFNRVGDWFATRGKSAEEKKAVLTERKSERAAKRAEKEARKQKRNAEKEARKAQKKVRVKTKGFRKK